MAKDRIKWIGSEPVNVPALGGGTGGRLVMPGSVHDVPEGWEIEQFTDQETNWARVKPSKTNTPTEG